MKKEEAIASFVQYAIQFGGYMELDRYYLINKLKTKFQVEQDIPKITSEIGDLKAIIDTLVADSVDVKGNRDYLLDLLTPPTSVVNAFFAKEYQDNELTALEHYHELSVYNETIQEHLPCTLANLQNIDFTKAHLQTEGFYPSQRRLIRLNIKQHSYSFGFTTYPLWAYHGLICAELPQQLSPVEILDHLFELQVVFPSLQIIANDFDQKKTSSQTYQVAMDDTLKTKTQTVWSFVHDHVEIKQKVGSELIFQLVSDNLANLRVLSQQISYFLRQNYQVSYQSYFSNGKYYLELLAYKVLPEAQYFGQMWQQQEVDNFEQEMKKYLGREV